MIRTLGCPQRRYDDTNMVGAAQDVDRAKLSQSEILLYDEGVKKGEDNVSGQKWWALGIGLLVGGFVGANLGTMLGAGVTARKLKGK